MKVYEVEYRAVVTVVFPDRVLPRASNAGLRTRYFGDTGSRTRAQPRQTTVACGHPTNARAIRQSVCRRAKKRRTSM